MRYLAAVAIALAACAGVSAHARPANFRTWLERDVAYLITSAERAEFLRLRTDDERVAFVAEFWRRRDPTPDTDRNEFYEEHYRRLSEADVRFGAGVVGWRTDRGRIYITWGPPDFVETNPAGARGFALGPLSLAPELPTEIWTYEHLPARTFGSLRAQLVFVDRGGGDYRLLTDPNDANLAYVYRLNTAANPLQYESAAFLDPTTGLSRTDRAAQTARSQALGPDASLSAAANPFDKIAVSAGVYRAPAEILDEIARSQRARGFEQEVQEVRAQLYTRRLPVTLQAPVFRMRGAEAYCPIAVSIPGEAIAFERADRLHASLLVHGEVKELPDGKLVRQFTEALEFRLTPDTYARGRVDGFSYEKPLVLPSGAYRIEIAIKDMAAQAIGLATADVRVPASTSGLSISGTILAERVTSSGREPSGPFSIGALDIVPRPDTRFRRGDTMHVVYQLSGYRADGAPRLTADYTIMRGADVVLRTDTEPVRPGQGTGDTLVVDQPIQLADLDPGDYLLQIKAIDQRAGRYDIVRTPFTVR
jgi:GWxTD domain-containing protein